MSQIAARIVTWVSIAIGVVGLALFLLYQLHRESPPIWDDALFSYGGVFTIVLFMNFVGKQASLLRSESDAHKGRPAPRPGNKGQQVALPKNMVNGDFVRLHPIRTENKDEYLTLVDEAVTEVFALQGEKPVTDDAGHVTHFPAEQWLRDGQTYAFLIYVEDQVAGIVVVANEGHSSRLYLLYVKPEWRRRRVGLAAIKSVLDFARLLSFPQPLRMDVFDQNMRGRRFLTRVGFVPDDAVESFPHGCSWSLYTEERQ